MFRTTIFAIAATAAIAAAAIAPTAASAKGGKFNHHGHGFGRFGITVVDRAVNDSCWQLVKVGRNLYQRQWVCN